jgi:hypothetical protein
MAKFNVNEVVLEKVKQASLYDIESGELLHRLTSIEDPSLNTTAEKEEVVNAQGETITDIYRAKKATFGGSNSLFSFDLAASQFGANKEVASSDNKIINYIAETLTISNGQVKLSRKPVEGGIPYIYVMENGDVGESYAVGAAATENEAVVAEDGTITVPTAVTEGKVYVEYPYESEEAVRVVNKAGEYPTAGKLVILALFRDKCTDKVILGSIICPKAKLNPESVDLSLTPTGKHPFEYTMMKDFCSDDDKLFEIVLSK